MKKGIACIAEVFLLLSCQKKQLPDTDMARFVQESLRTSSGYVYSKKYHTHVYILKNGCVVGMIQHDAQGELFFDDVDEMHFVLERGTPWQYKLEYSNQDDAVWVLFCNGELGRLFKITNGGEMTDSISFVPETFPDVAELVLEYGVPARIKLDSIEAASEYEVDIKERRITLVQTKNYNDNGYKP